MKLLRLPTLAMLLVLAAPIYAAGSGIDALSGFYERVHSFKADFVQKQLDEDGEVFQQSRGIFLLSRPERFRWEYQTPYEQIIVSNGKSFSFFDVDLAQVTVRDVDDTLRATPALLLSGGAALEDEFALSATGNRDGLAWVKLLPRDNEGDFKEIRIGLKEEVPARMELDDNLGQTTDIRFENVEINTKILPGRFELKIPKGVEVVDGRAASPK